MKQPMTITTSLAATGAAVAISLVAVLAPAAAAPQPQTATDEISLFATSTLPTVVQTSAVQVGLSDAEIADILFMREEEKLAHDVYVTLGDLWDTAVFPKIARAETAHMSSVETLIDRYGLVDPADGNPVGVFEDETLQSMYDDLVARGSVSLSDALAVGALIEEVDIEDLVKSIDETTAPDVSLVWQRLLSGSQNHLMAFTSQLAAMGVEYEPTVLDSTTFDQMLSEAGRGDQGSGLDPQVGRQGGARHGRNS